MKSRLLVVVISIGGSGGGGGGGSGGGNPPNPWWEEPCEEDPYYIGRFTPCDGVMGWQPIIDTVPPLTDSIIAIRLKRLYEKTSGMADSLFNKAQLDGKERTFTFVPTTINGLPDSIGMWAKSGTIHESSPTLTINSFGIWHSHQDEEPNNPNDLYKNQCFDGPDINKLYKNRTVDG